MTRVGRKLNGSSEVSGAENLPFGFALTVRPVSTLSGHRRTGRSAPKAVTRPRGPAVALRPQRTSAGSRMRIRGGDSIKVVAYQKHRVKRLRLQPQ